MRNQYETVSHSSKAHRWILAMIATLCTVVATSVAAEESVVISLHERIGREVETMKRGFEELGTESAAISESHEWLNRGKELPKDSPEFAQARAEFARALATDLEGKVSTAEWTYNSTVRLTDAIDQLIDYQSETTEGKDSVLGGASEEIIRQKARELQGVDRMMTAMISAGVTSNNQKVLAAQRAFHLKMHSTMQRVKSKNATGIEKLKALRDTTEGLSFLMLAYADGLDLQHMQLVTLTLTGETDAVFEDASLVIADALAMMNPDSLESEGLKFFMDSTSTDYNSMLGESAYSEGMADQILETSEYLISNRN